MQYVLFIIFFLSLRSLPVSAQVNKEKKKSYKDFLNIKAPAIDYAQPDVASLHDDEGPFKDLKNHKPAFYFNPERLGNPYVAETDTERVNPEDFSIVEVDEEYNPDINDSLWIKIAEYYSVWDNKAVNPYGFDITKFTDTIKVQLFDSTLGRFWHPPLHHTYLTDDFGPRKYRWHYGVDLKLHTGDSVFSVWDGIVRIKKYDYGGYGNYVVIRHYNGLETIYGHLSKQIVEVGDIVRAGELVGWGGSTGRSSGPHLHFEIRYQGHAFDPINLFDFRGETIKHTTFQITPDLFSYVKQYRKVYFHRVRRGDTLSEIAAKYNVSIRQILKLNRMTMRSTLRTGQKLRIR